MNEPSETVMQGTWTYETLVAEGLDPKLYEIVAGEPVPKHEPLPEGPVEGRPMNVEGGALLVELGSWLVRHVKEHDLGLVGCSMWRFLTREAPRTERKPDLAFLANESLPPRPYPRVLNGAPTLAVEVLSPTDTTSAAADKAREYLEAGGLEVWNVDPAAQTITVFRPGVPTRPYGYSDTLTTEVLPGFALPLRELFLST